MTVVGEKTTQMLQLSPTARVAGQLLAWANTVALVPVMEMEEIVAGAVPLLVSVSVCDADVLPCVVEKLSDEEVSVSSD